MQKNLMVILPKLYLQPFYFSTQAAGGGIQRLARQDPEAKKIHCQGVTPWFYVAFYPQVNEQHPEMMVYDQITSF